jgi:hypothetical protein
LEAVPTETPASAATSRIVAARVGDIPATVPVT